jgi:hypothetical protein
MARCRRAAILCINHTSSFYHFIILFVFASAKFAPSFEFLIALQISEQEIADGLALSMKRPPSQAELAAVVR